MTYTYLGTEANILIKLRGLIDPKILGVQLGIEAQVLKTIEKDHRDVQRQMFEVIKVWYHSTEESEHTWERIADAIEGLEHYKYLEEKLRELATTTTGKEASII